MKRKFVNASYQFIAKYEECDELKEKKIKYGLELLYNVITKLIVMLILSILLGLFKEYILFTIIFAITKRYTYGIHAKKSLTCWLITLPIYIGGSYFIRYAMIPSYAIYVIWLFGFTSFAIWAPADTPAKPLIHPEIRKKQKVFACITCLFYLMIILFFQYNAMNNAIIYSLIVQSICINPLTYLVTKTTYANYKVYYQKHGLNY